MVVQPQSNQWRVSMAGDTITGNSKTGNVQGETMNDLIKQIKDLCLSSNLCLDEHHAPIAVGPGVWMVYATELNEMCSKHGHCHERQRYVVQMGDRVVFG